MTNEHPSPEALTRFMEGTLSRRDNARVVEHLLTGCEACRKRTRAEWLRMEDGLRATRGDVTEADYEVAAAAGFEAPMQRALESVRRAQTALTLERQQAPELADELARHPHRRQITLVRNSRRFQTWGLCEVLMKRNLDARFRNARQALELAELCLLVAESLDSEAYQPGLIEDLKGRAWCQMGQSRRVASDFHGAREALAESAACLQRGTGDPYERARLLLATAALDRGQRLFYESIQKLDRALAIYRKYRDDYKVGKVYLEKGVTYLEVDKPKVATGYFNKSLELLDKDEHPRLCMAAEHNLVLCLSLLGQHEEAWLRLPRLRSLHREAGDYLSQLRLRWVEGKIQFGRGEIDEAEAAFLEVREGFAEEGVAYDVALASLDLAMVYARRGRATELQRLAAEVLDIARSRNVHRDALAALILFAKAARVEQVTLGLLREIITSVSRSRGDEDGGPGPGRAG